VIWLRGYREEYIKYVSIEKNIERPAGVVVYVCMNIFGGGETRENELLVELWGVRQAYATPLPSFL